MQSRFLFALGLVAAFCGALGACAKASGSFEDGDDGDGGDGGEASVSSSASSSSVASSSSGAGGGSSTSSSSSGAGGSPCEEMPCKLVTPQCGCPDGEQCTLNNKLERACEDAGTVPPGQACGLGAECAPGSICVTPGGASASICEKFCDNDSQCQAPGGLCVITLNDGMGGTLQGVTLCSENCDPATAATCPVAGTGCHISREAMGQMRFFTSCSAAGSGQQGDVCMDNGDCAPSLACFTIGAGMQECLKYCKINSPACPAGAQCVPIQINMVDICIGNEQYGACL